MSVILNFKFQIYKYKRRGFTLIELLLFMAISGIFLALATQVLQWAVDFQMESSGSSAVDLSGQYIYHRLMYDLRRSSAVTTPASAGQSGATLQLTIGGQPVIYSWANNRLTLTASGSTEDLVDQDVNMTSFAVSRTGVSPQSTGVTVTYALESAEETSGGVSQQRAWEFAHTWR